LDFFLDRVAEGGGVRMRVDGRWDGSRGFEDLYWTLEAYGNKIGYS